MDVRYLGHVEFPIVTIWNEIKGSPSNQKQLQSAPDIIPKWQELIVRINLAAMPRPVIPPVQGLLVGPDIIPVSLRSDVRAQVGKGLVGRGEPALGVVHLQVADAVGWIVLLPAHGAAVLVLVGGAVSI